jgi:hypothetical protein
MELLALVARRDGHLCPVGEHVFGRNLAVEIERVVGREDRRRAGVSADLQPPVIVVAEQRVADGQVAFDPRGTAAEAQAPHLNVAADPEAR